MFPVDAFKATRMFEGLSVPVIWRLHAMHLRKLLEQVLIEPDEIR